MNLEGISDENCFPWALFDLGWPPGSRQRRIFSLQFYPDRSSVPNPGRTASVLTWKNELIIPLKLSSSKPHILVTPWCKPEIRELQRSIETYDMGYFPQHVLLFTSTVHDHWAHICIHGYLRILWIRDTKS